MRAVACGRSRPRRGHRSGGAHGSPLGQVTGTGFGDIGLASWLLSTGPGVPATAGGPEPGVHGVEGSGDTRISPRMPRAHGVPRIGRGRGYRAGREVER